MVHRGFLCESRHQGAWGHVKSGHNALRPMTYSPPSKRGSTRAPWGVLVQSGRTVTTAGTESGGASPEVGLAEIPHANKARNVKAVDRILTIEVRNSAP
jgi:hypothetical protein